MVRTGASLAGLLGTFLGGAFGVGVGVPVACAQSQGPARNQPVAAAQYSPAATQLPSALVQNAAWWDPLVRGPLRLGQHVIPLTIDELILSTLRHSPQVRVIGDRAIVRRFAVDEANARFDFRAFMESRFTDTSDPVGNTLTTGGAPRYIDQNWNYTAGLRKNTSTGAQIEASQRVGYQANNSIFFSPNDQGVAKLALTVTQPLLNGAGRWYQQSTILLAESEADAACERATQDLHTVVFDLHRGYWDLYVQRAALLQRQKLYDQARRILGDLEARREVDVLANQLVRARAAVTRREAAMIRYAAAVKNTESRLRALVNSPSFSAGDAVELIPTQAPYADGFETPLPEALTTALHFRPEIHMALQNVKAAGIRAGVAQNELLPALSLVLGSYVYGLNGDSDIGKSLGDQLSVGRPTYWAGFLFEAPLGNRAASARAKQRQAELRQLTAEMQSVTNTIRSDVEIALRELTALRREAASKRGAVTAAELEIEYLTTRWRVLAGEGQDAGSQLDELLSSQERLADAEFGLVSSQAACAMAYVQLQKVTGQLLHRDYVMMVTLGEDVAAHSPHVAPQDSPPVGPMFAPPQHLPSPQMQFGPPMHFGAQSHPGATSPPPVARVPSPPRLERLPQTW